ncbi:MAG TPA: hypothetical protein VIS72_05640 [Anaerolineales bacterium]
MSKNNARTVWSSRDGDQRKKKDITHLTSNPSHKRIELRLYTSHLFFFYCSPHHAATK